MGANNGDVLTSSFATAKIFTRPKRGKSAIYSKWAAVPPEIAKKIKKNTIYIIYIVY